MSGGPRPIESTQRLMLSHEIAGQIKRHYGARVLAIGAYGSVARGTQGLYSDIELHCVLHGEGFETAHEWSSGAWKAEVDVYSRDVILRWASEVDVDWSLTHGAYTKVLTIYDPTDFFSRLRVVTLSQPDEAFRLAVQGVIVGELYELIGKIRNANASNNVGCLPYLAVVFAKFGACLIGLANRELYTSASHFFEESLSLPGRPDGYDGLCHMVMAGELSDVSRITDISDTFWSGVESWARERGFPIEEELETLLKRGPREPDA